MKTTVASRAKTINRASKTHHGCMHSVNIQTPASRTHNNKKTTIRATTEIGERTAPNEWNRAGYETGDNHKIKNPELEPARNYDANGQQEA